MSCEVFLSVGSNCRRDNVRIACEWLGRELRSAHISSIYDTPAVNGGCGNYANAVIRGITDKDFHTLNECLKKFETSLGRSPELKSAGIVPVDIDIVIYDGDVVREWDFRQSFFRIGFLELAGTVVEEKTDTEV